MHSYLLHVEVGKVLVVALHAVGRDTNKRRVVGVVGVLREGRDVVGCGTGEPPDLVDETEAAMHGRLDSWRWSNAAVDGVWSARLNLTRGAFEGDDIVGAGDAIKAFTRPESVW